MKNNTCLLTISVPTYNRANLLERQLENLLNQVGQHNGIEILVCDNYSNDKTQEVVEKYQKKNNCLKYFRQKKNEGLDKNVLSCYENAKGDFVWFLSDDDIIFDDAVTQILKEIKKTNFTVMAYSFCNSNNKENCKKNIQVRTHTSFTDKKSIEDFFKVIMISTLVLKKIDIDIDKLKTLPSTIFPQITLSLNLLQKDFILIANEKNILWREAGYESGNFFELYCLKPREAIRYSKISLDEKKDLLKFSEKSLKEFLKLSILERVGFYKSKKGFPFNNLTSAIGEYKNSLLNLLYVITIFFISKTPRKFILSVVLLNIAIKNLSIKKAFIYKENLDNHIKLNVSKAKSSDV